MRYDSEHKERTRQRVVDEAARLIRAQGADKIGVAALMAGAGLTHGGFYAHFKSKDELVAEAVTTMFDTQRALFAEANAGRTPAEALVYYVQHYLSMAHRERRDLGCPVAALAAEMVRADGPARARFEAGLREMIDGLAALIGALARPAAQDLARAVAAQLVGALTLARVMSDPASARQVLNAASASILQQLALG